MDERPEVTRGDGSRGVKQVAAERRTVVSRRWLSILFGVNSASAVLNLVIGNLEQALLGTALSVMLLVLIFSGRH